MAVVGLLSDAHGNGPAFDLAVSILQGHGVERIFYLGDAIGYIPSVQVLDSIEALGDRVSAIRGNHEAMFLGHQADPKNEGVYQLETVRPLLSRGHTKMIGSWGDSLRLQLGGYTVVMVHGSLTDPTFGYVYPDSDLQVFEAEADWVFMANTHRPFARKCGNTHYVNVGSCGLPRDDGRYGAAVVFDTGSGSFRILRFDITEQTRGTLQAFPDIHPSVISLFSRTEPKLVGEIV